MVLPCITKCFLSTLMMFVKMCLCSVFQGCFQSHHAGFCSPRGQETWIPSMNGMSDREMTTASQVSVSWCIHVEAQMGLNITGVIWKPAHLDSQKAFIVRQNWTRILSRLPVVRACHYQNCYTAETSGKTSVCWASPRKSLLCNLLVLKWSDILDISRHNVVLPKAEHQIW